MSLRETDLNGTKSVGILGVPLGYGAAKIGSELGVNAIRLSRSGGRTLQENISNLGYKVYDHGDVRIAKPERVADLDQNPKHLPEMIQSCQALYDSVIAVLEHDQIPIILGGDHSIAIGSFSALAAFHKQRDQDIGLLWFDAHADINTPETSVSGNIHGMPLAVVLGEGSRPLVQLGGFAPKLKPQYFAHVGARDLDAGERQRVLDLGLRQNFFTMSDIDKRGMSACMHEALAIVSKAPGGFAVTFDIDMIDPHFAPGSGTLVRGGATYREAHLALEIIADHGGMKSFEIVEVNPLLDQSNITVQLACELILSVLGKTIL